MHLTDGSTSREEILELVPLSRHVYRLTGFPAPFSWLVRHAVADWRFTERDGGTRIEWTYTFTLTMFLAWPGAWLASRLFRRAMAANLAGIQRELGL